MILNWRKAPYINRRTAADSFANTGDGFVYCLKRIGGRISPGYRVYYYRSGNFASNQLIGTFVSSREAKEQAEQHFQHGLK